MKRKLLLNVAIFATLGVFSQNDKTRPVSISKEDLKPQIRFQINENGTSAPNANAKYTAAPVKETQSTNSGSKSTAVNTWTNFSTSANIYGVLISYCNPLQYNDQLNAVSFIHRKPPSYVASPAPAPTAENGLMVAAVSTNFGTSWDSTLIWNNNTNWGRYPGGGIYNPSGNSLLSASYFVGIGPTTSAATGWPGNFFASKQLNVFDNIASTAPNAQQWMDITLPDPNVGRCDFASYAFTSTDDGKVRAMAGITDDNATQDTALRLITGAFTAGTFTYSGTWFGPPSTFDSGGGENWVSRPCMAWNEAGTVGYVAVMGSRIGATIHNVGLQPMVWKTTNSGASWAPLPAIDFNIPTNADVIDRLTSVKTSTLQVPNFLWTEGIDLAVDANDKLHLFSSIVGHYSEDMDSLNFVSGFGNDGYKWPHEPGLRPYLYDFMTDGTSAWTHMLIDSMSSEGASDLPAGSGFNENPWDLNGANKVRLDARLQLSRTPDGKYIFYSWGESDSNFTFSSKKFNVLPNIKVRAYGVNENLVSTNEVNITDPGNSNVASRAMYHFMSPTTPTAIVTVSNPTLTLVNTNIPFTVSNSPGFTQLVINSHWYNTASPTFSLIPKGVSVSETSLNSAEVSSIYPNPANTSATLFIGLKNNEKVEITISNLVGQVLKTSESEGHIGDNKMNIDLTGLKSGVYMVNIKLADSNSIKKLIVE